ncbi:formylglycine-generating enzyme family protein [soil metagenome]
MEQAHCCAPERERAAAKRDISPELDASWTFRNVHEVVAGDLVELDGGAFRMGTDDPAGFPEDGEGPVRRVTLRPFRISRYAVTNRQFGAFADATGYVTEAERFGWSFVFHLLAPTRGVTVRGSSGAAQWWLGVDGASWRHPEGPGSSVERRLDHPAVHISWHDAVAFCAWSGTRLATEAEWECAARGGLDQKRYAWGDELMPNGKHRCNIWQGNFPERNSKADGWLSTAPVDTYEPNGFGLYNVSGNVWEWCADWWDSVPHPTDGLVDPTGPESGDARVMRGGSYLCHKSYCNRYRVGARIANTPDSSTGNMGFRVAADAT